MPPEHASHSKSDVAPLDKALKEVDGISTLPAVAVRILETINDPEAGALDLTRVVETDPTLCVRLLRAVNSASSGVRSHITTLHQAISFLGFNKVRNVALTASVSRVFADGATFGNYDRASLWKHMVAVAVCSRMIATRLKYSEFEDIFLAGLLHDIGIIAEDQQFNPDFRKALELANEEPTSFLEVELEVFGFDHTKFGEALATRWGFPENIRAAIRYHHNAVSAPKEFRRTALCVEVSNYLCSAKDMTSIGVNLVAPPMAIFRELSMKKNDLMVLSDDLDEEIRINQGLFEL